MKEMWGEARNLNGYDGLEKEDQIEIDHAFGDEQVARPDVTAPVVEQKEEPPLKGHTDIQNETTLGEDALKAHQQFSESKFTVHGRDIKPLPRSKGKQKQTGLPIIPLEIILFILEQSAWTSTTEHARRVCLVGRKAYQQCRPTLHRIVAIRSASQFSHFAQQFVNARKGESRSEMFARQNALQSIYINNIPSDKAKSNDCASFLTMILTNARNLKRCHFEEHWSNTSSWNLQEQHTIRSTVNPLKHIARFPALVVRVQDNGHNTAFAQMPPKEQRKPNDWTHLVPKLSELTLSAHTISQEYLESFGLIFPDDWLLWEDEVPEEKRQAANFGAFEHLTHLHLYFANLDNMDNSLLNMLMNLPRLTHLRLSRPESYYESRYDLEGDTMHLADISEAIPRLLAKRRGCVKMESIIMQVGTSFDERVMNKLTQLQRKDKRLHLMYKALAKPRRSSGFMSFGTEMSSMFMRAMRADGILRGELGFGGEEEDLECLEDDEEDDEEFGGDNEEDVDEDDDDLDKSIRKGTVKALTNKNKAGAIANTLTATNKECEPRGFSQFADRAGGGQGVWSKDITTLWF